MNDWLTIILPNMSRSTKSALIEFTYNKTMKWLRDQGQEQKKTLISLAQRCRQIVHQEKIQEKESLLQEKLQLRNEAMEVTKKKAQEVKELVNHLKLQPVITSLEELNTRVSNIRGLSIPMSLQSAEIKNLVKQQVQVRSLLFKQNVTIFFSSKGAMKSE
jgi:ABC-type uncharacterized transport system permease subunit